MTTPVEYGDVDLLRLFVTRENHERYSPYVKEAAVLPESWEIFKAIGDYYKTHPKAAELDLPAFRTMYMLKRSTKIKPERLKVHGHLIDSLSVTPDPKEQAALLDFFVGLDYAAKVRDLSEQHIAGGLKEDFTLAVSTVIEDYEKERTLLGTSGNDDGLFVAGDMSSIIAKSCRTSGGLTWRLTDLNIAVGPVMPGDLIVVGARPNVGKTRFMVSELTHWMSQLPREDIAIIFNNEEDGQSINGAVLCATLNKDIIKIASDSPKYSAEFDTKMGWDRIRIVDQADMNVYFCEKVIKQYRPKVVVFNQLYKVNGMARRETNDAEVMRRLYQWAREIGKKYNCIVVSAHQADVSGEGQLILTQDKLYGTKTGLQGEADVILMIGKSHDPTAADERTINIAKNKLPGGPHTKPELRESSFRCEFKGAVSRYVSLLGAS